MTRRVVFAALAILAILGAAFGGWYLFGLRSRAPAVVIGDLGAVELRYERAMGDLLRDLDEARNAIARGQASLDELRRERDSARAELDAYHRGATERLDDREDGLDLLRAIGEEIQRRSK